MQVFISYKSEYREFAREVQKHISSWGYDTWLDQDKIPAGVYFRYGLQEGLESSDVIVGIMTSEAMQSLEVLSEWDYALNNSRLLLLRYRECTPLAVFAVVQHIDFIADQNSGLQRLRQELDGMRDGRYRPQVKSARFSELEAPEKPKVDVRHKLLRQQELIWVKGVLEPVEDEGKLISLALGKVDKVLQHQRYGDVNIPEDRTLSQIFDDVGRGMLILGAPGSGKTIALLQIARDLIHEALEKENPDTDDESWVQLPVVLNLSSWAAQRLPIAEWIIYELTLRYDVPRQFARNLVNHQQLILLLDGLDEVAPDYRNACVQALNEFRKTHRYTKMLVCSRIEEYQNLSQDLIIDAAVTLQPLTLEQIQTILHQSKHDSLREILSQNSGLATFASNPFHLNLMMMAYADITDGNLQLETDDINSRYQHLFEYYLTQQLHPRHQYPYPASQFETYITWLAKNLSTKHQTVFYIEDLDGNWLNQRQQTAYLIGRIAIFGVLALICSWLILATLTLELGLGLTVIALLVMGYVLLPAQIVPVELIVLNIDWQSMGSVTLGVLMGAVAGVGFGLLLGVYRVLTRESSNPIETSLPLMIFLGLSLLIIVLFNREFRQVSEHTEQRIQPNHGMKRSLTNGAIFGVLCGIVGLVIGIFFKFALLGLILGLLIGFLIFGGGAVIKHVLLRLILRGQGMMPTDYHNFLTTAVRARLLRQTGGGFIFIHRLLRDYLADEL